MGQDVLHAYEKKGLCCSFIASKSGGLVTAQSGDCIRNEIAQMVTIVFETIDAIGTIQIDKIEMLDDRKGLILSLDGDRLFGSLFEQTETVDVKDLWKLLEDLKAQPIEGAALREIPEAKVKVLLKPSLLDEMKEIVKGYLGDFTERIYKNQVKAQRININELNDEDSRKLVAALTKAAAMIIGPSKSQEMESKLLALLREDKAIGGN